MDDKIETGLHLKRPCILVTDLERSLSLYRDLLGFKVDFISETASPNSYLYTVFKIPQTATLKFASLSTQYEDRALALTEVKGIQLPKPNIPTPVGLVMRIPDLETAIAKITELGLETVAANNFSPYQGAIFTEQGFWDYDGHLIILYQIKQR